MILYKFTDNGWTRNGTEWVVGKKHEKAFQHKYPQLCSGDVFHAYEDLNVGLVLNPRHNIIAEEDLVVFECEGEVVVRMWDKAGCYEITPLKIVELPEWYTNRETRRKVFCILYTYLREREPGPLFDVDSVHDYIADAFGYAVTQYNQYHIKDLVEKAIQEATGGTDVQPQ